MLDVQACLDRLESLRKKLQVGELLREGDAIRWGRYEAQVLHTPGHTQGSVCLYMPSDIPVPNRAAVDAKSAERAAWQALCRRHLVCGKYWPHGFVGRIVRNDYSIR